MIASIYSFVDEIVLKKASVSLTQEGFVVIRQVENIEATVKDLKSTFAAVGKLTGGKAVPVLFVLGKGSYSDEEARVYTAKRDSSPFSIADAYVLPTIAHAIRANFYMLVNKPQRPTKFFKDEESAIEWLRKYL